MNRNYELVVILDPELKDEEQEKLLSKIEKFVSDFQGKISSKKNWGKKEFAYLIKKKKIGLYCVYSIIMPSEKTASFKQRLLNEDKLLRYLMISSQERSHA